MLMMFISNSISVVAVLTTSRPPGGLEERDERKRLRWNEIRKTWHETNCWICHEGWRPISLKRRANDSLRYYAGNIKQQLQRFCSGVSFLLKTVLEEECFTNRSCSILFEATDARLLMTSIVLVYSSGAERHGPLQSRQDSFCRKRPPLLGPQLLPRSHAILH
jgi:hypothetical protein